jgi:predicted adenylyl cyclase CyaB
MTALKIIEIKAKYTNHDFAREVLKQKNAVFNGKDFQSDVYFNCPSGRLKLRKGNIENNLIFYKRVNQAEPKESDVKFSKLLKDCTVEEVLAAAYKVLVTVNKTREIYFTGNAKVHLDFVEGLGSFIEIEVFTGDNSIASAFLEAECKELMCDFKIVKENLIDCSYSDMLLKES